ncbi:glycogen synthase GlgA [Corynebacterium sp. AOP40-9SA-29]|uniref:glycogen synthase GlgA n=1 Tax=Corynebacterium sp. AOP40-9SA-29 TaxID=3457677 RepID=UPI0040341D24
MSRTRHVLSVASECAPLLKTGGLADVVGALPAALAPYGWASRVLLPGYPAVLDRVRDGKTGTTDEPVWQTDDLFGGPAAVLPSRQAGLDLLVLDAPHLFDRAGGPYGVDGQDHPDNHVRFAALSWVGAQLAVEGAAGRDGVWRPDLVHVHDWQAGLVPSYLRYAGADIPTVMSIHNIAFQGVFGADQLDRLKLPTWDFHPESLEYHGLVSSLKAGMVHSDLLTTVSPTYAEELATPEFGFGLEGVVAARRDRGQMAGILNGIDTTVWDPAADPHVVPYSAQDQSGKQEARRALLDEFDLPVPEGPLAVVVTRLTHQKGVDLLLDALPSFIDDGGAVVVLGSGDPAYERGLLELQDAHPRSVAVRIGYDEPLSHRMYAGGDLVLVPSRFEPCGLTQMYGQRYGAVPLVAATGGLRDTVTDATPESLADGTATGFTFGDASLGGTVDAGGLRFALGRAVDLYADPEAWARLRTQAMLTPVDWSTSASRYAGLFATLLE